MRARGKTSGPALAFVCALGTVLLLVVASCTGGRPTAGPSSEPEPASANPSPSVDPSVAAATDAAVAAYNGYIAAFAAALQAPDPDDPNLPRYVADPLLGQTRRVLRSMKEQGTMQVGAQTASVTRTEVDLASDQPVVRIHACLDYSALRLVYRSNGSPVPNATIEKPRLSVIATVWLYQTGQWLVNDSKEGGDSC